MRLDAYHDSMIGAISAVIGSVPAWFAPVGNWGSLENRAA
jgi:hypothetical protein